MRRLLRAALSFCKPDARPLVSYRRSTRRRIIESI